MKNHKLLSLVFLLSFLSVASPEVRSQVYLGASYTYGQSTSDATQPEMEAAKGYRAYLGNRVSNKLAIEFAYTDFGEYEVGNSEGSVPNPLEIDDTLNITAYEINYLARFPLTRKFSFTARFGVMNWEGIRTVVEYTDATQSQQETFIESYRDWDILAAVGLDYKFLRNFGFRLEVGDYRTYPNYQAMGGAGLYFIF